jgi:hypothetical protein
MSQAYLPAVNRVLRRCRTTNDHGQGRVRELAGVLREEPERARSDASQIVDKPRITSGACRWDVPTTGWNQCDLRLAVGDPAEARDRSATRDLVLITGSCAAASPTTVIGEARSRGSNRGPGTETAEGAGARAGEQDALRDRSPCRPTSPAPRGGDPGSPRRRRRGTRSRRRCRAPPPGCSRARARRSRRYGRRPRRHRHGR